jgi:hypothetical protein
MTELCVCLSWSLVSQSLIIHTGVSGFIACRCAHMPTRTLSIPGPVSKPLYSSVSISFSYFVFATAVSR